MAKMTREERFLMKERMKEHRHQAKIDELRRKKELAEIKDVKAKAVSRNLETIFKFFAITVAVLVFAWYMYFLTHLL